MLELADFIYRFFEADIIERFDQIIYWKYFKGLDRVLRICRSKDNHRMIVQSFQHIKTCHIWQMNIEKKDIRSQQMNQVNRAALPVSAWPSIVIVSRWKPNMCCSQSVTGYSSSMMMAVYMIAKKQRKEQVSKYFLTKRDILVWNGYRVLSQSPFRVPSIIKYNHWKNFIALDNIE